MLWSKITSVFETQMETEIQIVEVEAPKKARRFVFVLLEQFTMLSFASAVECLRIANRMSNAELYS